MLLRRSRTSGVSSFTSIQLAVEPFERQPLDLGQVVDEVPLGLVVLDVVGADDEAVLVQALPHIVEHVRIVQFFYHCDLHVSVYRDDVLCAVT